jgi:hypothetical protein
MSRIRSFTPMINIQSTLRTAPDLCQNVSLALLFASNGNSYTNSKQSDMCVCVCVYVYTNSSQYRNAGRTKNKKKAEITVNAACLGNLSACHFGYTCQRFVSPAVGE